MASMRITKELFDENWKARHRQGEADYAKTQLTETLPVRALRFVLRSAVGGPGSLRNRYVDI